MNSEENDNLVDELEKASSSLQNMSVSSLENSIISCDDNLEDPNGYGAVKIVLKNCTPNLSHYFQKCKDAVICNASIPTLTKDDIDSCFSLKSVFAVFSFNLY